MLILTFTLVTILAIGVIFIALPKIKENDQMKKQKKLWDESDNYL